MLDSTVLKKTGADERIKILHLDSNHSQVYQSLHPKRTGTNENKKIRIIIQY